MVALLPSCSTTSTRFFSHQNPLTRRPMTFRMVFLGLVVVISSLFETAQAVVSTRLFRVEQFVQERDIDVCFGNLLMADADGDQELSPEEFLTFILFSSGNRLNFTSLTEVPVNLLMVYYYTACLCSQVAGDFECCVGDNAHLDLVNDGTGPTVSYFDFFCRVIEEQIDMTTFAPTFPPTLPPSLANATAFPTLFTPFPSTVPTEETPAPTTLTLPPTVVTNVPTPGPSPSGTTIPPVATPVPTSMTPAPSETASSSPTVTGSASPTVTASASPTVTASASPTVTGSASPTVTASASPTITGSASPTVTASASPTVTASASPTVTASASPTVTASASPTVTASASPTVTASASPTVTASASPTVTASASPTVTASASPTVTASASPTVSASASPTVTASASPTVTASSPPSTAPSLSPTVTASEVPSSTPTTAPTTTPSMGPTVTVSASPTTTTMVPSMSPSVSMAPSTMMPTVEGLLCVDFQYSISNDNGFDAQAIFNEEGNTLKTGLLIATENITIRILNETFPAILAARGSVAADSHEPERRHGRGPTEDRHLRAHRSSAEEWTHPVGRHLGYMPPVVVEHFQRRLVTYSPSIPPEILAIVDEILLCPSTNPMTRCAVVVSSVCVILDDTDDPGVVRSVLIMGLSNAIANGDFAAAIPEEHTLDR